MANSNTLARAIIEIGTSGVSDAEAQLRSLEADLRDVGRQYAAGTIQIDEYLNANNRLHNEINSLRDGLDTAQAALKRYGSQAAAITGLEKDATKGVRNTGMAFLELSRAFEDAQYGLRGVINNIPSTIQMFGGPAGLAAGASAVAVAFSMATPAIKRFMDSLDSDAPKIFDRTLQGIKEKIEELEKKPLKFDADYQALDAAKETLREINKGLAAYQALRDRSTSIEQERGQLVSEAVVEHAGGDENLAGIIEQIRKRDKTFSNGLGHLSAKKEQLEKEIADEELAIRSIEAMGGDDHGAGLVHQEALQKAKAELAKLDKDIQEKGREKINVLVGNLVSGSEAARKEVEKLLQDNAEDFRRGGVQDIFGFELGQASTEEIKTRRKDRISISNQQRMGKLEKDLKEKAKKEQTAAEQAQADKARPVIAAISKGRGLEAIATKILEDLEKNQSVGPDGTPMDAQQQIEFLQEQIRSVIEEDLKAKGLLNKGSGKAASATATQIAAAARANLDRSAEKSKTKMERDLQKEVGQTAGAFGPKINDELQAAVLNRMARGEQDAVIQRDLAKQLSQRMAGAGVEDPRVADEAAAKVVEKVLGGLRLDLQMEGPSVQEAAQNRLNDLLRKVQSQRRNAGNARETEALAQNIEANSFAELGVQFSPEQSQAAAKKAVALANQGVNANAALQMALQEQLGAMNAIGNQLMQQDGMLRQFAQEFQMVRRGIQTRQRTAAKR